MEPYPHAADLHDPIARNGALWNELKSARIFITGGTGFFGRWLLESFAYANQHHALNAEIVVLTRHPERFAASAPHLAANPAIQLYAGDVRTLVRPQGRFTHIIHAATESSGMQKHHTRLHMAETILDGTRHVLEFAREARVQRMLFVSTGAVYGTGYTAPIPEHARSAPCLTDAGTEYSEAKRMAETLCTLYAQEHNLPVSMARCFTFVGPHLPLNEHFAIGNFIRDALAGNTIHVQGDGTAVRSYLYAADLAHWLWAVLLKGKMGQPYNVGSDQPTTIAQLAQTVASTVNSAAAVNIAQAPIAGAPISYQVPDTTRARSELGLEVTVSLGEAIRRTAEWHRHHPLPFETADEPSVLARPDAIIFDFDGVMTDNRVAVSEDGKEAVFCNRSDGLGIDLLKKRGIPMLVISLERNPVVAARCRKLGIECMQGIERKDEALCRWLAEHGLRAARTVYLGNDINDLACMRLVGFPVAVGDAYAPVKAIARWVLTRHGGHGAVRELADAICALEEA